MRALAIAIFAIFLVTPCGFASPVQPIAFQDGDHSAGSYTHPIAQYTPDPAYTERARRAGIHGSVVLRILIGPDGCAHHIHLLRRLGWGLDQAAIRAVRAWRFRPPLGADDGVPARIHLSFSPSMADRPGDDLTPCTQEIRSP